MKFYKDRFITTTSESLYSYMVNYLDDQTLYRWGEIFNRPITDPEVMVLANQILTEEEGV